MTSGWLSLIGLCVLLSPLWKVVPDQTAWRAEAEERKTDRTQLRADFLASHPQAAQCGSCHLEQFKEWSASFHAQSLTSKGFLRAFPQYLEFLGKGAQEDPQAPMACFNCHAPLLKNADREMIRQLTELVLAKETGKLEGFEVGCVACHADVGRAFSGPISDPKDNPFHTSKFSTSYKDASFCSSCHAWVPPSIPCSNVYNDWKTTQAVQQGKTCQSCHMAERSGIAGAGGPLRKLQSHSFAGARSVTMLRRAVELNLKAAFQQEHLEVTATVRNLVPHRIPDG